MITYDPCFFQDSAPFHPISVISFDAEDKQRLLTVLKRGVNTLSPPDMEIVNLIREMEDDKGCYAPEAGG